MTKNELKNMTTAELKKKARYCGGLTLTLWRGDQFFDEWDSYNSSNWDCPIYFEVREREGIAFIWLAVNSKGDPKYADYAEENCVMFRNTRDFYDFLSVVRAD